ELARRAGGSHAHRVLAGALARALSRPRQGPREPDARRAHRGRRLDHHLACEAHPAQVPDRGHRLQRHRLGVRSGLPLERLTMRLTLRAQVVLVALVLAVIPLVGYVHVKQMERLLREGQEQALLATARAIATALHDRPQLLELRAGEPASGEMALILRSLARAESRIWIVDRDQRLLALVGDLKKRAGTEEPPDLLTRF